MLSIQTPRPPRYPSEFPEDDAVESGLIDAARNSALVYLPADREWRALRDALMDANLLVIPVAGLREAEALRHPPRVAVVDVELLAGLDLVQRLASAPRSVPVIAALEPGGREGPALRAGARATLRHPLDPADVMLLVDRLQASEAEVAARRELFARKSANAPARATMRVAAAITHEIRNPLMVARMNFAMISDADAQERGALRAADRTEMMRDIDMALGRINAVVDAVSGLARGEPPKITVVDLDAAIRKAVAMTPNACHVAISVASRSEVRALANEGLLVQVIANLLGNAFHAVRGSSRPAVVVRTYTTSSEARISVRDNGPGVPLALRERIFEPLFSTKGADGNGLGLAIARHAVMSMGGALTLSGEPPPGACFRVRLRPA